MPPRNDRPGKAKKKNVSYIFKQTKIWREKRWRCCWCGDDIYTEMQYMFPVSETKEKSGWERRVCKRSFNSNQERRVIYIILRKCIISGWCRVSICNTTIYIYYIIIFEAKKNNERDMWNMNLFVKRGSEKQKRADATTPHKASASCIFVKYSTNIITIYYVLRLRLVRWNQDVLFLYILFSFSFLFIYIHTYNTY